MINSKKQSELAAEEIKLKAYCLEHEHYLSEFKILLTATLSVFFGIMIAVATGNLHLESIGDPLIIFYVIILYGLLIILGLIQIYRKLLRNVRNRIIRLGENNGV
ncbi:MAG TPA: hypothetical protein VI968_02475 [archaeon]|nr:hypothetical protein [archaeon]